MRFRIGSPKDWAPASFNDTFAVLFLVAAVALWVLQGMGIIMLRDDANGALTVLVTLVVQFYFRKRKEET